MPPFHLLCHGLHSMEYIARSKDALISSALSWIALHGTLEHISSALYVEHIPSACSWDMFNGTLEYIAWPNDASISSALSWIVFHGTLEHVSPALYLELISSALYLEHVPSARSWDMFDEALEGCLYFVHA
eukprot:997641-Pelagomonas_calceolata.AAC.2